MKSYPLILILLLTFFTNLQGQKTESKESVETTIQNLIIGAFDDIWADLDTAKISKYHTQDFLLLEHGEVWNNDTIANYLKKVRLQEKIPTRINKIEFIDTKISENRAWVAYHNYATISIDGKVVADLHWLESATAVLTPNGWKLDMLHSTRIRKE